MDNRDEGVLILEKHDGVNRVWVQNPTQYVLFSNHRHTLQSSWDEVLKDYPDGTYKIHVSYGGFGGSKVEKIERYINHSVK